MQWIIGNLGLLCVVSWSALHILGSRFSFKTRGMEIGIILGFLFVVCLDPSSLNLGKLSPFLSILVGMAWVALTHMLAIAGLDKTESRTCVLVWKDQMANFGIPNPVLNTERQPRVVKLDRIPDIGDYMGFNDPLTGHYRAGKVMAHRFNFAQCGKTYSTQTAFILLEESPEDEAVRMRKLPV